MDADYNVMVATAFEVVMGNYDDSWDLTDEQLLVKIDPKKKGQGANAQSLKLCTASFNTLKRKCGPKAVELAIQNLERSLALFGKKGEFWYQGEETYETTEDDVEFDGSKRAVGVAYCAIGAIHKANGQSEHLARLATDLAAGYLFPKRALGANRHNNSPGQHKLDVPDVVEFNDNDNTKFADVKAVFKFAQKLLKKS